MLQKAKNKRHSASIYHKIILPAKSEEKPFLEDPA